MQYNREKGPWYSMLCDSLYITVPSSLGNSQRVSDWGHHRNCDNLVALHISAVASGDTLSVLFFVFVDTMVLPLAIVFSLA